MEKNLKNSHINPNKGGAWFVAKRGDIEKIYAMLGGALIGMGLVYYSVYIQTRITGLESSSAISILLGFIVIYFLAFPKK